MNWKRIDANFLCVSNFFRDVDWYLGVIGNLHNDECVIYIFTVKSQNGDPSIFNKSLYHCWYK